MRVEIFWKYFDEPLVVEGDFDPGEPDRPYLRNGDPGYPGYPASFEIEEAYYQMGKDKLVLSIEELTLQERDGLEELACQAAFEKLDSERYDGF